MLATLAAAATIAGCPLFPAGFSTNQRVDALPVAPDSAAIVRSIGLDGTLKADFGSGLWDGGPIGIPYDVVGRRTPRSRVRFDYAAESDRVRYPIPPGVHVEGGPDADGDEVVVLPLGRMTRIGRRTAADIVLDDTSVSRRHAMVLDRGGEPVIADDRSLNGVYVNGRRVREARLHHGDEVQIGARVMRFLEV